MKTIIEERRGRSWIRKPNTKKAHQRVGKVKSKGGKEDKRPSNCNCDRARNMKR